MPVQNQSPVVDKEEKPQVLFKPEVEESPEEILKKRIAEMEVQEKKDIAEHEAKIAKETEEAKEAAKESMANSSFGALPKYQELFKSSNTKLPPLPPLPKFEPPKTGGNLPKFESQKVSFLNQSEEPKIPQPPQFAKKTKVEFVDKKDKEEVINKSITSDVKTMDVKNPSVSKDDTKTADGETKMTYEELFGNDKT